MYVLLTQQKRRYCSLIERMNEDNKRKQVEIDHLRSDMAMVRRALSVAGLQLDLKELHLFAAPQGAVGVVQPPAAAGVLPPIGRAAEAEECALSRSPTPHPPSSPPPASTSSVETAHSSSPRRSSARSRTASDGSTLIDDGGNRPTWPTTTTSPVEEPDNARCPLPPIRSRPPGPDVVVNGSKPRTKWMRRVQGAKAVREKQWKELRER
ncbi:hypothetical protein BDK51DRAFT_48277 [Blyttiomyces helicus]|uniref:Uncharacterized protein n=1 Tax=Blyttiomyces helicus TaxID=388810 RepID=A0A4P9W0R0_9FUNG|nr:hypothetical protein BDK51DRAFT_48277 [Blyttiomyces helicus]|eukprot:RKO84915.1 hypothetical protein BDK51DRAFT_48277 [Blyttiomyces helicus]